MPKEKVEITNQHGIHSRPASELVKKASKFKSDITLKYDDNEVNAKSILGIMVLAIEPGSIIEIETEGDDEEEALEEIIELIENEFYVEYDNENS